MQDNSLTAESTNEQDKAGLTHCSPEELARLRQLNADYLARFDFPFILAVRGPRGIGLTRGQIIATFERRLDNPPDVEFREALRNIHRIVEIRLADKFGLDLSLGNDIWDWHERLSVHSDPGYAEQGQLTVTYLTDAHRACAQRISHWMRDCGFDEVEIDAVGNVVGRYRAERSDAATLMTGSHYDTVRNGGKYDGRLGIFVPMACVRELHRQGRRLPYHLEVIGFAEEEGQRYAATFLGSGALVGDFRRNGWTSATPRASRCAKPCSTPACASTTSPRCGAIPRATWASSKCTSSKARCCSRWACRWAWSPRSTAACATGAASSAWPAMPAPPPWTAGATRPPPRPSWPCTWTARGERRRLGRHHGHAGRAQRLDQRGARRMPLQPGPARARQRPARRAGDRRAGRAGRHLPAPGPALRTGRDPARRRRASAPAWQARWERVEALGLPVHRMPSGAGHDAMKLHEAMPQAMLFVRGQNFGISHNPLESTTANDMQLAAQACATCSMRWRMR